MFMRTLIAVAMLTFPVEAVAQCKPGIKCPRTTPTVVPFKPKVIKPDIGRQAPAQGKVAQPTPGKVISIPKINTPQPPARRPGTAPTVPASSRPASGAAGASGSVMNKYICQTPETYCRLNTFEVVASGAACHCRGVRGKIE